MKTLKLTSKEEKALIELIANSNTCRNGCVYENMQNSKKDCDECEFTGSIDSISNKLEGEE
jgi:hypothetical protein